MFDRGRLREQVQVISRPNGVIVVTVDSGIQMPKDRPDQETFEDGTSYLFGPGTTPEASSEAIPTMTPRPPASARSLSTGASPAAGSTQFLVLTNLDRRLDRFKPGLTNVIRTSPNSASSLITDLSREICFSENTVSSGCSVEGGMGEVWLVRHQILRDQFALKMIVPGVVIDDESVKRFVREAQVMRQLVTASPCRGRS